MDAILLNINTQHAKTNRVKNQPVTLTYSQGHRHF